jgi:hypothetical protein
MPQCQHYPIFNFQAHQGALNLRRHLIAVVLPFRIGVSSARKLCFFVQLVFALVATKQIDRFIDRYAVNPAEKLVLRVVFVKPFGNSEENDLGNVIRILSVAQNPVSGVVHRPLVTQHQHFESRAVPFSAAFHQRRVVILEHNYTGRWQKLEGRRDLLIGRGFDVENLVEAGIQENVADMAIHTDQPELAG